MKHNRPVGKAQVVYFSHGGGPLPILGDKSHQAMVDFMRQLPAQLGVPETILVISAHWEEPTATLLGAQSPPMFYDYYGFPEEAYDISYPAPGNPDLANKIAAQMRDSSIPVRIDSQRGFDHGVFITVETDLPESGYSNPSTIAAAGA